MSTMSSSENIAFRRAHPTGELGRDVRFDELFRRLLQTLAVTVEHELGEAPGELDTPSEKYATVAEMSRGGLRLRRNQRVARSTSLRHSRSILVCIWASTTLSRDSISSHRAQVEHIAGRRVRPGDLRRRGSSLLPETEGERGPPLSTRSFTTQAVISRRSLCSRISSRKRSRRGGEVALQLDPRGRVLGEVGVTQLFVERDLGVREQDGELGGGEAYALGPAFGQSLVAREELELAVEAACSRARM